MIINYHSSVTTNLLDDSWAIQSDLENSGIPEESENNDVCAVILQIPPVRHDLLNIFKYFWGKYLWHLNKSYKEYSAKNKRYKISYEVSEEQLGYPEEIIASTTQLPLLWEQNVYDDIEFPDIFTPAYKRKLIFSKEIKFNIKSLPQWKPHILINKNIFDEDE